MIAGAILLLAASILFCKHVDHYYAIPRRGEELLVLVPTIIVVIAGVILLVRGFKEK
jgi:hypothetical protein